MHRQQPLSLNDAARQAVAAQDGSRVCRIADTLRFKHQMAYAEVVAFFERAGADRADIEVYLQDGDSAWEEGV